MRLKRVKIYGFKTFADKTEFDLIGNFLAVVGPNGCGKSNLVDAILWGLGEGNARHLRAHSGQDVIFSGSSRRKAVGYAEVTLLFDNEDGALPVQSSEVSVTRRLTRSGDSEYYINRQSCRLKDVFDLFADTGIGRTGYSIVGQKDIDQALAASAEDRRAWVDEAAGVQRYRVRKVEAIKRLNSAHDHLSRVRDILSELEGQREPLREEAEVAIRYKSILSSLREVESGLLVVEVAKAIGDVGHLEQRIAEILRLAMAESEAAEAAEGRAKATGELLRELENELDRARSKRQTLLTASERAEASIKLGEQKLSTLDQLEQNLGEEAFASQTRVQEAEAEISGMEAELDAEKDGLGRLREDCAGAGDEARFLKEALRTSEEKLADARRIHLERLKQDAERAQLESRAKAVARELKGIEDSLPDLRAGMEEAKRAYDEAATELANAEGAVSSIEELVLEINAKEIKDAEGSRRLLTHKAALEGKRQGIEATIEAHEGLAQGARAVLEARKRGILTADYLPVGEALEVKKQHALAIETALGASVNDLIVDQEADAKAAIDHLKTNRLGRATFQPLTLIRSTSVPGDLKTLLQRPGVIARACEIVTCSPQHRPVVESLLGRVLVVENLDTAFTLAKTSGWSKLVTLDGEVLFSSGAVSGGVSAKTAYGLVQRKADLSQVCEDLSSIEASLRTVDAKSSSYAAERALFAERLAEARGALARRKSELKEAASWLHDVQHELTSTERSGQRLAGEMRSLGEVKFGVLPEADLAAIEQERDELVSALASRSADADAASERLRVAQGRVRQAEIRLEAAQKRLLAAREHERLRERKVSNLGPERHRANTELASAAEELVQAQEGLIAAEAKLVELQTQRANLLQEIENCTEAARTARSSAQIQTDAAHKSELERARLETRRAASTQRLLEEYGISEEEALLHAPNIELPSDASSVVGRLRKELKAMGDVNLGAVEAYERLSERWNELTIQSEDILGGIREVEASVRELDKLTRERFLTTFKALQEAFSDLFQRLFSGGEASIFLANEENLLESGVEIDVMLPGKKKQRLELLSGGERSLCAAAFLFALLRVKPSPLVILDEVDAPLDGRNVERYIDLVRDFAAQIQFILITHNPTTIEAAPVWLGVSMQEPGVSMLIPAQFAPGAVVDAGRRLEGSRETDGEGQVPTHA